MFWRLPADVETLERERDIQMISDLAEIAITGDNHISPRC
jgi:hypothetical protein